MGPFSCLVNAAVTSTLGFLAAVHAVLSDSRRLHACQFLSLLCLFLISLSPFYLVWMLKTPVCFVCVRAHVYLFYLLLYIYLGLQLRNAHYTTVLPGFQLAKKQVCVYSLIKYILCCYKSRNR